MQATTIIRKQGYKNLILGLTGNYLSDSVIQLLDCGADMVMSKPLRPNQLDSLLQCIQMHGFQSNNKYKLIFNPKNEIERISVATDENIMNINENNEKMSENYEKISENYGKNSENNAKMYENNENNGIINGNNKSNNNNNIKKISNNKYKLFDYYTDTSYPDIETPNNQINVVKNPGLSVFVCL